MGDPVIFECKKSRVALFRASHVKFICSTRFRSHNGIPQEPRHCPKLVEPRIRASILIVGDVLEPQSENCSNGGCTLVRQTDLKRFALAVNQILKPCIRWGTNVVSAPCNHEQTVKLLQ